MPKREKVPVNKNPSFFDHLEELRKRILIILLSVFLSSFIIFFFFNKINIYNLFLNPLYSIQQKIYYYNLLEPFLTRVKISFILGIIINIPLLVFQITRFSFPGFKKQEKKMFFILISLIFILFTSGVIFSYKILLPNSINFLIKFAPVNIKPVLRLKEYIGLYLGITIASGLTFLFPILISFLTMVKLINYKFLLKHIPESIIIILIISALITPPDIFSQILLSLPLFLLYLISILFSFFLKK